MAHVINNPAPGDCAKDSEEQFSVEERRALIARVARSELFSRSARLRDFLLYAGKQSLKEGCQEINEQEIGVNVFGRHASYDRGQDNIVRVTATELRRRIETYFATEGIHETLVLDIPRGGYKPVFHRRQELENRPARLTEEYVQDVAALNDTESTDTNSAIRNSSSRLLPSFSYAMSLVLIIVCILLFLQNYRLQSALHPWRSKPAVAALWGDFLHNGHQTDVVLSDDSVSVIEEISDRPTYISEYLSHDYMQRLQSSDLTADKKADINDIFGHNLVTYGGVVAAARILAIDPGSSTVHLAAARFYQTDWFKRDNVVLLGGKKANPWVYLFDNQLNFDVESRDRTTLVVNHHPQGNEQAEYRASSSVDGASGYSVVAYLPNPSRTSNTIIIAGTDSDATDAAAAFLTSEDLLEKFRKTLHADRFPYFEALLKTSQLTGTSLSAEIVAYRTYPQLH